MPTLWSSTLATNSLFLRKIHGLTSTANLTSKLVAAIINWNINSWVQHLLQPLPWNVRPQTMTTMTSHAMLAEHAQQCPCADDYEHYIGSDNNPSIKSALGWWKISSSWISRSKEDGSRYFGCPRFGLFGGKDVYCFWAYRYMATFVSSWYNCFQPHDV